MPMHLLAQDRKIFPQCIPINRPARNLMHNSMCGMFSGAPPSFNRRRGA
jgi:hypothetical protein